MVSAARSRQSRDREGAVTSFTIIVYDGNLVLQERDQNDNPMTTYTRGVDLSGTFQGAGGVGGLLARSDNQKIVPGILTPINPNPQNVVTSYYFSDIDGNVVALCSPIGMLLAQYKYDPFGNLISKSGLMADINKYRFSSKEWEGNAGLYYYGYRLYDPNLQRWVNRDPLGDLGFEKLHFAARNVSGIPAQGGIISDLILIGALSLSKNSNPFEFVRNDPLGAADWQGLYWGYIPSTGEEWWDWIKAWGQYINPTEYDPGPLEILNGGNDVLKCGLLMYPIEQNHTKARKEGDKLANDPNAPMDPNTPAG